MADPHIELEELRRLESEARRLRARLKQQLHPVFVPQNDFHVLRFTVGNAECAMVATLIERVLPIMQLRPAPEAAPWIAGFCDLGDATVPIIDVIARWGNRCGRFELEERVIVAQAEEARVGLIVQRVAGVEFHSRRAVAPPAVDLPMATYAVGLLGGEKLLLLDPAELARESQAVGGQA